MARWRDQFFDSTPWQKGARYLAVIGADTEWNASATLTLSVEEIKGGAMMSIATKTGLLVGVIGAAATLASVAHAGEGGEGGEGGHGRRVYVPYYEVAPPPVVYVPRAVYATPPPVYYVPERPAYDVPTSPSININIPLR